MLRLRTRSAFKTAATFLSVWPALAGCSNDKPTELVPGALSQVQVPRDLDGIELEVKANGVVKFCGSATVQNGAVDLPRTFGVVAGGSAQTIVTITLRGFSDSAHNLNFGACADSAKVGAADGPQVLRRSIQTFVGQHTLFLPMSLSYSCFNSDCSSAGGAGGEDSTSCKASRCVDLSTTDPQAAAAKLVDFTPSLVTGTDVCFSPAQCFLDEQPAIPLGTNLTSGSAAEGGDDAELSVPTAEASTSSSDDCTYTFAATPRGSGVNVKVFYQDFQWQMNTTTQEFEKVLSNAGEVEILDKDPEEGFTVSPDNPQQITLAPGLCDLVHAVDTNPPKPAPGVDHGPPWHTISGVHLASICPPKTALLPICAGERNPPAELPDGGFTRNLPDGGTTTDGLCNVAVPLVPTPSAVYMVMDDSASMRAAFGTHGYATAMGLSLTDPIFKRTYAAFRFLPHNDAECTSATTSLLTPDIDFALAATAQSQIASRLQNWTAPGDTPTAPKPLDLQAAMRLDAGAYGHVLSYLNAREPPDIAAVMFFVNRVPLGEGDTLTGPLQNDCNPPLYGAATAKQAIETETLAAFHANPSLQTFFVVLASDPVNGVDDTSALTFFDDVAANLPQAVTTLDATSANPQVVLGNFASVVERLGTCLYESPVGTFSRDNLSVSYGIPGVVGVPPTVVNVDTTCTAATQNTSDGWNIDEAGRIRICGASCASLRQTILAAEAAALQAGLPSPDVPVTVTAACGPSSDSGAGTTTSDAASSADATGATPDAAPDANQTGTPADATVSTDANASSDAVSDALSLDAPADGLGDSGSLSLDATGDVAIPADGAGDVGVPFDAAGDALSE